MSCTPSSKAQIDPVVFYHQARSRFAALDANSLRALVARRCPDLSVDIAFKNVGQPPWAAKWLLDRDGKSTFLFPHDEMTADTASIFAARWTSLLDVFLACQECRESPGITDLHLGDASEDPGLVFCSTQKNSNLIPDSDFLASHAYEKLRETWRNGKNWADKKEVLFWRGSSTGIKQSRVEDLPRVRLCMLSKQYVDVDCFLTAIVQLSEQEGEVLIKEGLLGNFVDQVNYDQYKYHIDIDGNSSAWSSLFCKLLSGGLVFKVDSISGYKQWYYDKLIPWKNYVPVRSDLTDLLTNFRQMQAQPDLAEKIAKQGRELALSLTYESQVLFARDCAIKTLSEGKSEMLQMPNTTITRKGDTASSLLAILLDNAIERGRAGDGKVSTEVMSMEGMSGRCYRLAINNFIASVPFARYLEVGSWAGSTSCSAMEGNKVRVVCIDNWSEFGGPKSQFLENTKRHRGVNADFDFIENDFRSVPFVELGLFNVYLFDGPHEEKDQYDGLALALPALDDQFVFIVDDWNWDYVRRGTLAAIAANNLSIEYSIEIRTTLDNSHPEVCRQHSEWHNGYFLGVLRKQ